jgi:hypothetical protein
MIFQIFLFLQKYHKERTGQAPSRGWSARAMRQNVRDCNRDEVKSLPWWEG